MTSGSPSVGSALSAFSTVDWNSFGTIASIHSLRSSSLPCSTRVSATTTSSSAGNRLRNA